jgi:hypothetical protein
MNAYLRVVFVMFAITLPVVALQKRESAALSDLAIQVTNQLGHSIYMDFAKGESKRRGSFTLPPGEIIKRADKDSDQVSMIYVSAAPEQDAWRINVSVVKGEFYDKGEQDVATFLVRENEKVTVKEMQQFGVKAFDISIVRVNRAAAIQPEVKNRTESIAVMNVEATILPAPYRLSMKNLSNKNVLAVEVDTYAGEQMLQLQWPQGGWEHPLIEPGATYEMEVPSKGRGHTNADGYSPEQSTSIEVSAVVFTDGTYEGKPYLAAVTKAQVAGSKTQLTRVLRLLAGPDRNSVTTLKEAVSLLSENSDPDQLAKVQRQFSMLSQVEKNNLANFERAGLHNVKASLLKEIGTLEGASQPPKEWLAKTQDKYERWLAALGDQ